MEKTGNQVGTHGQLLQARDQNLQQVEKGSLRPHGKLWGMDVFSWYNPMVFELENTLSCFPAPVLWFGNESDVARLFAENGGSLSNVKVICTHDKAGFCLPDDVSAQAEMLLGTSVLKDALHLVKAVRRSHGILLFTASGEDWKERQAEFEFYLDLHQIK